MNERINKYTTVPRINIRGIFTRQYAVDAVQGNISAAVEPS
nr:hypothetical protein [Arthrobacter polaris]